MVSLGRFLQEGGLFIIRSLPGVVMTIGNCRGTDGHHFYDVNEILMKLEVCSWVKLDVNSV